MYDYMLDKCRRRMYRELKWESGLRTFALFFIYVLVFIMVLILFGVAIYAILYALSL